MIRNHITQSSFESPVNINVDKLECTALTIVNNEKQSHVLQVLHSAQNNPYLAKYGRNQGISPCVKLGENCAALQISKIAAAITETWAPLKRAHHNTQSTERAHRDPFPIKDTHVARLKSVFLFFTPLAPQKF
jgi:hypothetical protein